MPDKDLHNLILRAEALLKTNWLHAVQLLNQAVEEHPNDPRPLVVLGDFFQSRQLFDKAIKSYQSALKLSPDDDHLKLIIGNSYFATGDYNLAIVYYDQIKNPHNDVRYNKALALAYEGKHQESIVIMRQLIDLIDNNPFIYFLLIEQLLRVGDYQSARDYITRAESKIGSHRHLLLLKALTYAHFQNWLMAYYCFTNYERGGELINSDHMLIYADCAIKCGMSERAVSILQQAIDLNPYAIALYEEIVRLLIQHRKLDQAKQYLKKARRFFPLLSPLLQLLQARLTQAKD
jgi:tetratricopeptide (TPR) repeat protein